MPKGFKMKPKWSPKSMIFHAIFEKGENAPDLLFSHISRGSGHAKRDEKSRQINAKSMLGKVMQKVKKLCKNESKRGTKMLYPFA